MNDEYSFLIAYGLRHFVAHARHGGRSVFTIRASEGTKMTSHAASLIAGSYGEAADIQLA